MPILLPRPVKRSSEPDPESTILGRYPALRSFDAPDSLVTPALLTEQPPKPRPVPAPIPRGPVPSPLGMIVSPLYFGRFFLFPGHRSPTLRTFPIHAGNSAFMRFPVAALRAYAGACWSCRAGSAHTAGFSASLTLPHSAARSHSSGSCSVSSWHSLTFLSRLPQIETF